MKKQSILRSKVTLAIILTILTASALMFLFILSDHNSKLSSSKVDLKQKLEVTDFKKKQDELQNTFKYMYEGARTISLLPSVRQITGDNRNSADEDVVKQGRFSNDAYTTVQQIYNNLADNVSVSEVYAVVEGLDYKKGQVPFFMFDSLILGPDESTTATSEVKTADTPEESEDAEYEYFPKQIALIKAAHPTFDFKTIDDIPALITPVLRTCDNTQYISISKDNVKDTNGIMFSVPFYTVANQLRGVISVIFRTNTLEASLLDVPFLIITDSDKKEAAKLNFSMPKENSNYLLYNEKYNIYIYDRRNIGLSDKIIKGIKDKSSDIISSDVTSKADGQWKLAYLIPKSSYTSSQVSENKLFGIKLIMLALVAIVLIIMWISYAYKRDESNKLKEEKLLEKRRVIEDFSVAIKQVAQGDLKAKIKTNAGDDFEGLAKNFEELMISLSSIIAEVQDNSGIIAGRSEQLDLSMDNIAVKSLALTENASAISEEVGKLSSSVEQIYFNSKFASDEAKDTERYAADGSESINNTLESMKNIKAMIGNSVDAVRALDENSKAIGDITTVINAIAKQTNLLALNAAIEASRAGEAGKGFEVVASEIRKLAKMTAESTSTIENLISTTQKKSEYTLVQMERTNEEVEQSVILADEAEMKLSQIVSKIEGLVSSIEIIRESAEAQAAAVDEIEDQEKDIKNIAEETSASIETNVEDIKQLANIAKILKETISIFTINKD